MTVTIDPPKFIVYCSYHDTADGDGGLLYVHAETPFEAHLQHCQRITKMSRWECCLYLEESAWTGTIHRVTGPYLSEAVSWQDRNYPWDAISRTRREYHQLEKAIPLAVQLKELAELLPDFALGAQAVTALEHRLEAKKVELATLQADWELAKTKPPEQENGREHRGIQLDAAAAKDVVDVGRTT